MATLTCEIRTLEGESLGVLLLETKVFASGKVGWHGQAKLVVDGERYQAQSQLVRIAAPAPGDG